MTESTRRFAGTAWRVAVHRPDASIPRSRTVGNILVALFAITLCLINAVVWTFVSDMPLAGVGWVLAAAFCFYLQKWSNG